MGKVECINNNYSTTKLCYKLLDNNYLDENEKIKEEYKFKLNFPKFEIVDSEILAKKNEKYNTYLFLPEGRNRKGEGGLRTKGCFKFSYEKKDGKWWIVENNKYIKRVDLDEKIVKNYDKLPLITIITVVYNGEKYLEETIQSIINQNYPNVEYIIIDGGSTDKTIDIIKKYEDKIDYWVSEKDKGIYDAMNKGIDLASGEWINFMNAGDKLYKKYILNKIFLNSLLINYNLIYGDVIIENKLIKKALDLKELFLGMRFSHQSTFYKYDYIKKNKYNLLYKYAADYESILKCYLEEPDKLYYFNIVVSNILFEGITYSNKITSTIERIKIIRDHNKLNIILFLKYIKILIKDIIKYKLILRIKKSLDI